MAPKQRGQLLRLAACAVGRDGAILGLFSVGVATAFCVACGLASIASATTKQLSARSVTRAALKGRVGRRSIRQGLLKSYCANGRLRSVVRVAFGRLHGKGMEWYCSGKVKEKFEYSNGRRHGTWIYFSRDGKPYLSRSYKQGRLHGVYLEWYKSGKIKCKGNYVNGMKHGIWVRYYGDSSRKSFARYRHGSGVYRKWHKNGTLLEIGEFRKGRRDGLWLYYFYTGELHSFIDYKNGLENGETVTWYRNGGLRVIGHYRQGAKHGIWRHWNPHGSQDRVARYRMGKRIR